MTRVPAVVAEPLPVSIVSLDASSRISLRALRRSSREMWPEPSVSKRVA